MAKPKVLEGFFKNKWTVWTHKFRYIILAIFVIWFIISAVFVSQITAPTENPSFLPEDNKAEQAVQSLYTKFYSG